MEYGFKSFTPYEKLYTLTSMVCLQGMSLFNAAQLNQNTILLPLTVTY